MEPQEAIDLGREAIKTCLMIGGPILLVSLLVGLAIGAVQAMTQIPDQAVSFVPKVLCLILVLGLALPWLTERMLDYSREVFSEPLAMRSFKPHAEKVSFHRTASQPDSRPAESESPAVHQPSRDSESQPQPNKNPFHLPNYRFSRGPKQNIDG